jgi:hypothetical protein
MAAKARGQQPIIDGSREGKRRLEPREKWQQLAMGSKKGQQLSTKELTITQSAMAKMRGRWQSRGQTMERAKDTTT